MRFAYAKPDGEVVWKDRRFSDGPPPESIEVDGVTATRSRKAEVLGAQIVPVEGSDRQQGWPMTCWASGVHPEQAQDLRDYLRKAGVPTEVTRGGDPVYTSAEHRRRALRARGMVDRSSYY